MEVTINNRTFTATSTGLKNMAYRLVSGKMIRDGIRNYHNNDLIIVVDRKGNKIGAFLESTGEEVVF